MANGGNSSLDETSEGFRVFSGESLSEDEAPELSGRSPSGVGEDVGEDLPLTGVARGSGKDISLPESEEGRGGGQEAEVE